MNPEARDLTTDAEIDAALERARLEPDPPMALSAEYNRALDVIILHLNNGRRLVIPREDMQGLQNATPEQLSQIEIHGVGISWPQLDVDHNLLSLLEGRYGNERWMRSLKTRGAAA